MTPLKKLILLYLKGLAMGSADVVPGVSGGTIAFITGIYEPLLNAIRSLGAEALNLLRRLWKKREVGNNKIPNSKFQTPNSKLKTSQKGITLGEERSGKQEVGSRKMNCSTSLFTPLHHLGRVLCVSLRTLRFKTNFKLKTQNSKLKTRTDFTFLAVLMAGIATSVLTSAKLITHLLSTCPIQVWSFFFGLIVVSSLVMLRQIKKWNFGVFLSILSGMAAAYLITVATPSETPEASWFLFVAGAVAVCAMILPGISGSFILLLFGKYEYVLTAIKDFKIADLAIFGLGCLVGLLSFARVISWLFKKFHNTTIGLLSGFMIGSLNKVWPWKEIVQTYTNRHNELVPLAEQNVLPAEYLAKTGQEPFFLQAMLFAAGGFLIVLIIDRLAFYLKSD